ncbi:hypothetical protein JG688_00016126 [Phytophthora aleatoria]|uniref:Uncharacterized protein n=1 Tax=Phytophthora aleatoria TaxID=2496075 RepID=A0A8J5I4L6_9STRA|nr:hypothetical protein JG688_00016126 [Phytophthora aleatoria]
MPRQPNSPEAVTRSDSLRGNVVRLECPRGLNDKDWDGPIYAQLIKARRLRQEFSTPLVAVDSIQHPGWLHKLIYHSREYDTAHARGVVAADADDTVVIPYRRLTRPFEDLSPD